MSLLAGGAALQHFCRRETRAVVDEIRRATNFASRGQIWFLAASSRCGASSAMPAKKGLNRRVGVRIDEARKQNVVLAAPHGSFTV
jgi:hypothetical protein